jgi:hypothetical protein
MKRSTAFIMLLMTNIAYGQVANDADGNFDSTTYVETNNTTNTSSTSASTSNNTNLNTNNTTISATNTNNNTNLNTNNTTINATNTNTNNNILSGGTNNTNTNNNTNVNFNNTSVTATNSNTNTNNNTNVSTSTANNTNVNTNNSTVDSTATTNNTNTTTSDNTNTNYNESVATNNNTNVNENRNLSESNQTQDINQKIESPPPSAIAPSIGSSYSQDLCTTGVGGAVQTQIIGISAGKSVTDENCERIKLSKTLYDMGMRVAAVSLMCQDDRVWTAMKMAGTPCPYQGLIGDEAGAAWEENLVDVPGVNEKDVDRGKVTSSPNGPR